ELNQPLGAILSNAEVAKILLERDSPDINQLKEIVDDIYRYDRRAADIIKHLRGLLKRKEIEFREFDLNEVADGAMHILEPEATKRGIALEAKRAGGSLIVRADPVHV